MMVSDTAMLSGRRRRRGGRNEEWMVEGWKERGKEGEGGRKEALRGVVDAMSLEGGDEGTGAQKWMGRG